MTPELRAQIQTAIPNPGQVIWAAVTAKIDNHIRVHAFRDSPQFTTHAQRQIGPYVVDFYELQPDELRPLSDNIGFISEITSLPQDDCLLLGQPVLDRISQLINNQVGGDLQARALASAVHATAQYARRGDTMGVMPFKLRGLAEYLQVHRRLPSQQQFQQFTEQWRDRAGWADVILDPDLMTHDLQRAELDLQGLLVPNIINQSVVGAHILRDWAAPLRRIQPAQPRAAFGRPLPAAPAAPPPAPRPVDEQQAMAQSRERRAARETAAAAAAKNTASGPGAWRRQFLDIRL